jgi:hypothetical protein
MKKESLSSDSRLPREALRKQLITMACCLERTRLYLDSYIYPRDLSLNLIDVDIEEKQSSSGGASLANPESRKKAMHLTERLYNIVYKDFFTAYEKATLFTRKINKLTGQDLAQQEAEQERLQGGANKISVQLNNELLEDDRESIMLKNVRKFHLPVDQHLIRKIWMEVVRWAKKQRMREDTSVESRVELIRI